MSFVALDHSRHYQPRHHQEGGDIGLYHRVVVGFVALVLFIEPQRKPRVVDEYVDGLPLCGQALYRLARCLTVAHIERKQQHLPAEGGLYLRF